MSEIAGVHPSLARPLQMVAQHPANELARFSLGKAYFNLGDFVRAREQLVIALEKNPDWMVVQMLVGRCDLALGERAAAKIAFGRARQLAVEQHHEGPLAEMDQALLELAD
jgi:Flp pilus assembly protein TadD